MDAVIAGGGIGGLTMALTCRQIGLPVHVYEARSQLLPLGLGIALQPVAVRELHELGLHDELGLIGTEIDRLVIVDRDGRQRWSEPRGRAAGWRWPQLAVHRGQLHAVLHRTVIERIGAEAISTGRAVTGYEHTRDGVLVDLQPADGAAERVDAPVLIAADGLHSAVRSQMFPGEAGPRWRGSVLWRGTALAPPVLGPGTFLVIGDSDQRLIVHPISGVNPASGLQTLNWIAERRFDASRGWRRGDWDTRVDVEEFIDVFEPWRFDWLDVPSLIRRSEVVYEYPMVDRDPVAHWTHGSVALIGDAAHPAYPISSSGATQAIVDARVLGAAFVDHGVGRRALDAYQDERHGDLTLLVLRNRTDRTSATLGVPVGEEVDTLLDGSEAPRSHADAVEAMADYRAAVGAAITASNEAPPRLGPEAHVADD